MADYISREAAIEALCKAHSPYPHRREISVRAIQEIPTAKVQPVVHGRWIPMTYIRELTENGWPNCRWEKAIEPDSVDGLMCSECGEIFDFADARNFCTQCGADMRNLVEIDQVKEEPNDNANLPARSRGIERQMTGGGKEVWF